LWGDGTPLDTTVFIVPTGTTFLVEGSHTYLEESPPGGWQITTTIHHESAPDAVVNTLMAIVSDPSVSGTGGYIFSAVEGALPATPQTVATFQDPAGAELSGGNPAPGEYAATITWGDASAPTAGA